jgi:hypothetical protein
METLEVKFAVRVRQVPERLTGFSKPRCMRGIMWSWKTFYLS